MREPSTEKETHHKQSSAFGMNLDEPFPDKAINCKCPTLVAVCRLVVGGQMGNRVPKWINSDLRLIIKRHDWDF